MELDLKSELNPDRSLRASRAYVGLLPSLQDGELVNDGHGAFLTTDAEYGDAEFRLEYRTVALADSGIYLRGCPQVQIWDCTEAGGKWPLGADKGSGGLWNNPFPSDAIIRIVAAKACFDMV